MTKIRNQRFYSEDREWLQNLASEFEWIGREYQLDLKAGTLTVFALPRRHKKSRKSGKPERNKRAESAARRQ